jgi:hypothetical protein
LVESIEGKRLRVIDTKSERESDGNYGKVIRKLDREDSNLAS